MKPERFQKNSSGRLLKVGRNSASYWTFIPHPLPPTLSIDVTLMRSLSEADRSLGQLAGLGRSIPNPHLLIGPFVRREAVLSSRIEGTQADIADLYAFEAGQLALPGIKPPPSKSDVREVANYVGALEYGLERVKDLPVSLRLMRELHGRLMEGVRGEQATPGEFRKTQNWIGKPGSTINDADFVPPPVGEMKEALDALEKYLHKEEDYPPLIRLALSHYQLEAIHPFIDGNGRIGRLLISLLLVNWNLLPLPLLYLSAYFSRRRQDYYDLLLAVSEQGDWRQWILFFLEGVAEQSNDAVRRAKQLQDLQQAWRIRLSKGSRASALPLRLADKLFEFVLITIPQVQVILDVTYPTAKNAVQKLVDAGVLYQLDEDSYPKLFVARDILQIVQDLERQEA